MILSVLSLNKVITSWITRMYASGLSLQNTSEVHNIRKGFHFECEHISLGSKGTPLSVRVEVELALLGAHVLETQRHKVVSSDLVCPSLSKGRSDGNGVLLGQGAMDRKWNIEIPPEYKEELHCVGGGQLTPCTDVFEMASLTESGGVWPIAHQRAETVEFCMPHLMVTVTGQFGGVMCMWSICKSLD
ncbi:hypothetical protein DUI87_11051 [Hirundo rustica rustica]|uniref:Uncharacterized protein n=1 Tax=Hirundo rustica rustica TaxID=333673 RepID=A0A3M0KL23_HIRRU|nr:hypothetical protein DUI87_11051 [Hirundo rustica rustica]